MKTRTVQTCGKLYLAGEYAILYPGQTALIVPIPIYMTAQIGSASHYRLSSDMFDYTVDLEPDGNYGLIQAGVRIMETYLHSQGLVPEPVDLTITGKMEQAGKKYGIGSSGSVVLLTLKALAAYYDLDLTRDQLFKLACLVLLQAGDNGSMGDLACIAYEDLIAYTAFDRSRIRELLPDLSLVQLMELDWGYDIRPVKPGRQLDFLVGWTQEPAISKDLVNQVQSNISQTFLSQTQTAVLALEVALTKGHVEGICQEIKKISDLLDQLHPAIYTDKLRSLVATSQGLEAVTKSSGAGGGDCGIALSFSPEASQILIERWQKVGLVLLSRQVLP